MWPGYTPSETYLPFAQEQACQTLLSPTPLVEFIPPDDVLDLFVVSVVTPNAFLVPMP
jgi:hypothetical protein